MLWSFFINPDREGKGPWVWGCATKGKELYRLNSLPAKGGDFDCLVLSDPVHSFDLIGKVQDKIDKGYQCIGEWEHSISKIQAAAVGTFLTLVTRAVYEGQSVSAIRLWESVVDHIKSISEYAEEGLRWKNLPRKALDELLEFTLQFCDYKIPKSPRAAEKGRLGFCDVEVVAVSMTDIVGGFKFKEGVPSPIW